MGKEEELKLVWLCENCGTAHHGVDPPDACSQCDHVLFDNLFDQVQGLDEVLS